MFDKIPADAAHAVGSALGSAIALRWIDGPWLWRFIAFCSGCFLAFMSAAPLAELFGLSPRWVGTLGFMVGALAIAVYRKLLEVVHAFDGAALVEVGMGLLRGKFPGNDKEGK